MPATRSDHRGNELRGSIRSAQSKSHSSHEQAARLWHPPRLETDGRTAPSETPRVRYPSLSDSGQPWFRRPERPTRLPATLRTEERLPAGPSVGDISVRMIAILAIAVIMIWLAAVA